VNRILEKFLNNVQKSLLIKLLQSNCDVPIRFRTPLCQIATELRQKIPQTPFLNSEVTGLMFTKFLHNVAESTPCDLFKAAERSANLVSNAIAKSKGSQF